MALMQKTKGGTWNLLFRDPRRPHQKNGSWKSCQTKDHAKAQRIEIEIVTLSRNRDHWEAPEATGQYLAATLRIWGRKTYGAQAAAVQTRTEPSELWLYGDRGQRQVFETLRRQKLNGCWPPCKLWRRIATSGVIGLLRPKAI